MRRRDFILGMAAATLAFPVTTAAVGSVVPSPHVPPETLRSRIVRARFAFYDRWRETLKQAFNNWLPSCEQMERFNSLLAAAFVEAEACTFPARQNTTPGGLCQIYTCRFRRDWDDPNRTREQIMEQLAGDVARNVMELANAYYAMPEPKMHRGPFIFVRREAHILEHFLWMDVLR